MPTKASKEDEMMGLAVTLYNSSGIMTVSQSLLASGFSKKHANDKARQMKVRRRVNKRNPSNNLLSDSDIAERSIAQIKKNRVVRTLKSRRGNVGGGITRGLRKHSRTSDSFLRQ